MSKKQPQMLYGIIALVALAGILLYSGIIKLPTGQILNGGVWAGPFTMASAGRIPLSVPYGIVIYGSDFGQLTTDMTMRCMNVKGTYYVSIKDQSNTYYNLQGQPITQTCGNAGFPCAARGSFDLESACVEGRQTVIEFNDFVPLTNGTYTFSSLFMSDSLNTPVFDVGSRYTTGVVQINCGDGMIPSGQGYCYFPGNRPGSLTITSNPSGALVGINGNLIRNADGSYSNGGITPLVYNVQPVGTYKLRFYLAGYYDQDAVVDVAPGQAATINVNMVSTNVPSPTPIVNPPVIPAGKAAIRFDSYPQSDIVFFSQGLQTSTPKLINDLTPGTYQYKFKATGYADFFDTITVQADQYYVVYHNFLNPTPVPSYATLTFQSNPTGSVLLGSQQAMTPYTFSSLAPGAYSYNYQLVGYDSSQGSITVEAGKSYTISHTFALSGQPTPTLQPVPKVCPSGTVCGLDGKTYVDKCTALNTSGGIQGVGPCLASASVSPSPTPTCGLSCVTPTPTATATPAPTQTVTPTPVPPVIGGGINLNVLGGLLVVVFAAALYYGYSKKGKKR